MTRLAYQVANFTYPGGGPADIFPNVIAQAKTAEASDFDRLMLMDHFYQVPGPPPGQPILECYTTLAAIAQHTESVRLSALVTGNTFRNPAVLAKMVTTLDHVSGGRATLGIGAGWYELEHTAYGIPYGTFTDRFEKLEEALNIILPMLRGERPTLEGKHYQVKEATNSPAPISRIPIMIGGDGEKKTLRMVAQYADESNLVDCDDHEVPRKLEVLAEHCERLGRDRSEIVVTKAIAVAIGRTHEDAVESLRTHAEAHGLSRDTVDPEPDWLTVGDPDTIGQRVSDLAAMGLDGITLAMPTIGHDLEMIALAGQVCDAALG